MYVMAFLYLFIYSASCCLYNTTVVFSGFRCLINTSRMLCDVFVVVGERSVAKEYLPIKFKNKKSLILINLYLLVE